MATDQDHERTGQASVAPPPPSQTTDGEEAPQVVEHSTPWSRLLGVVAAFGALAVLGHYLDVLGRSEDVATVFTITLLFTVTFWANRRPDKLRARFGPFGRIAEAIRESQSEIHDWVRRRTLLAGVLLAAAYGVVVVIMKHVVLYVMAALYSPWLALAGGLAVGAAVVAPDLWRVVRRKVIGDTTAGPEPSPPGCIRQADPNASARREGSFCSGEEAALSGRQLITDGDPL